MTAPDAPNLGEVNVDLVLDVSKSQRRVEAEAAKQARAAGKAAEKELNAAGNRAGRQYRSSFRRGIAPLLRDIVDLVAGAGRVIAATLSRMISGVLLLGVLGAAQAAIGALSGAVVGLAGAVAQALGVVAALPGAIAAVIALAATLVTGFQGVGTALSAVFEDDAAALAEALADLAPAAREFVLEIRELRPALHELRLDVQQRLFQGLGQELETTARVLLPRLRNGLLDVADASNVALRELTRAFGDTKNANAIELIFVNTAESVRGLSAAIQPLISGLLTLAVEGSAAVRVFLVPALVTAAQEFNAWMTEIAASGELSEFLRESVDALGDVLRLLRNVGSIITTVLAAGRETGSGLLQLLGELTADLARFLKSAEGQDTLRSLFESARLAGQALLPVVKAVFDVIGRDVAPLLAQVFRELSPGVVATIRNLGVAIKAATPGIVKFAEALSVAFLRADMQEAIQRLGVVLGNVFARLAPALAPLTEAVADFFLALSPFAGDLAQSVADLLIVIAEAVSDPVFLQAVRDLAAEFPGLIRELIPAARELIPLLPPLLQQVSQLLQDLNNSGALDVLGVLLGGLRDIGTAVAGLSAQFEADNPIESLINLLTFGLFGILDTLGEKVKETFSGVSEDIGDAVDEANGKLGEFASEASSSFAQVNIDAINSTQTLIRVFGQMPGVVGAALSTLHGVVSGAVRTALEAGRQAALAGAAAVGLAVGSILDASRQALAGIGSFLYQAGRDLVLGMLNGIRDVALAPVREVQRIAQNAINAVQGVLQSQSPSRVFMGIGEDMMRGWAIGIGREADTVIRDVERITNTTVAAAESGQLPRLGPFTIEVPVIIGDEVVRLMRYEIAEHDLSTVRRIRAGTALSGG